MSELNETRALMRATTDDVVRMAIEDLFPDQIIPDENNYLSDGKQHKAPDHSILDGRILIERKSRNAEDKSQFYHKLVEISKQQGQPFYAFGRLNLSRIIEELPDPASATMKMTDFMMRQTMKSVLNARKKFEDYSKHVSGEPIRVVMISDNTEMKSSTATEEHFLGRKMGARAVHEDETGIIDAIFFVKNPNFVFDENNSYWFKCLIKRRLSRENINLVESLSQAFHSRISRYEPYFKAATAFRTGYMRTLIV